MARREFRGHLLLEVQLAAASHPTLSAKNAERKGLQNRRLLSGDLFGFGGLVGHLEVVLDREDAGHAVCLDEGDILVGLVVDYAIELNMAVLHGDADRLGGVDGVLVQDWIAIDGTGQSHTRMVVHDGDGIDFDVADDLFDARIVACERDRIVLVPIKEGVSAECDYAIVDVNVMALKMVSPYPTRSHAIFSLSFAWIALSGTLGPATWMRLRTALTPSTLCMAFSASVLYSYRSTVPVRVRCVIDGYLDVF